MRTIIFSFLFFFILFHAYAQKNKTFEQYLQDGQTAYEKIDYPKAKTDWEMAQSLAEKKYGKNSLEYAKITHQLGILSADQLKLAEAENLYKEAKQIREKLGKKQTVDYAHSCTNLGILYFRQRKYPQADSLLQEGKSLFLKIGEAQNLEFARCLIILGDCQGAQGRFKEAEVDYLQAKKLYESLQQQKHIDYAELLVNLAASYLKQNRYEEAKPLILQTMELGQKQLAQKHPIYLHSVNSLAVLYYGLGNKEEMEGKKAEAKEKYKQSLIFFEELRANFAQLLGKNHPNYAIIINNTAALYVKVEEYTKAEELMQESLGIFAQKFGTKHPDYINALNNLASLYRQTARYPLAQKGFAEVIETKLGEFQQQFPHLNDSKKKLYLANNSIFFKNYYTFLFEVLEKQADTVLSNTVLITAFNLQIATKGLLLSETQKIKKRIKASGDTVLIKTFDQWNQAKNQIAKINLLSIVDREKQGLSRLTGQADSLEKQLSKMSNQFAAGFVPKTYTIQDIQAQLKPNEVAIEMVHVWNEYRKVDQKDTIYLALLVSSKEIKPVVFRNGGEMERKHLLAYQTVVTNPQSSVADLAKSYKVFFEKIAENLPKVPNLKIYFSPDGVYNQINLNTLFDAKRKKYILELYDIQLVTNLKEIIESSEPNPEKTALLMGNPSYQMTKEEHETVISTLRSGGKEPISLDSIPKIQFLPLPQTQIEISETEGILKKEQWKVGIFLKKEAVEERIKGAQSPKLLHLATHGYFVGSANQQNAMLASGLVLAGVNTVKTDKNAEDGVLTAYEVSTLNLDQTDLVVLSACETGLGKIEVGEGVYGLQRGFKVAGAKSILMSLWKVNDFTTKYIMQGFYKQWVRKGSPSQALQTAQLSLLKDKQTAHPFYWGAFVCIGR